MKHTVTDRVHMAQRAHAELAQTREALDAEAAAQDDREAWKHRDAAENMAELLAKTAAAIAGGEYRPRYEGWSNRETWTVNLWINNEQDAQIGAMDAVERAFRSSWPSFIGSGNARPYFISIAADALKEYVEGWDAIERVQGTADLSADLIGYALAVTDWREIAEGLAEELPTPVYGARS